MILYNITVNIDEQVHSEWLNYMQAKYIPAVMQTGHFKSYKMFRILSKQEGETGHTYSIQFFADTLANCDYFRDTHELELEQNTIAIFGGRLAAFRTILEEV